jgi:hypothetical protein
MASAWSMALRQSPGYGTAAPTTSTAAPTIAIPALPSMPSIDDARAPNAAGRTWIGQQLGSLPSRYTPIIDQARTTARANLAGYGGVTIADDNTVTFDPNARLGQREKQAVQGEENAANARGLLFSSFANQNIGNALLRMNEEKRAIVNQFAASINNALMGQANDATSLVTEWVRLYGEDSRYLLENPPPAPVAPVPEAPVAPPDPYGGVARAPGDGSPIVWKGANYPNLASLQAQHPGQPLGVRRAGDGSYVVVIGTGNAQPPAAYTPPRPSQVVNGGRPTGRTGRGSSNVRTF